MNAATRNTRSVARRALARSLAEKTADSYSFDRYRSWESVVALLVARGYTPREVEAIVRSKWTRWAADQHGGRYGTVPAKALGVMLDSMKESDRAREVAQLVAETFPGEDA